MSTEELTGVFARIAGEARAEGRAAMEAFALSYLAGLGGQLMLLAPSRSAKRSFPEVGYRSEQYNALSA